MVANDVIAPVFNLERIYGLVSGGSAATNATGFQAACDDLEAAGGGIIYCGVGTFDLNTRIDLPSVPFSWIGPGPNACRFQPTGSGTAFRRMNYASAVEWRDVFLHGFTVTNQGSATVGFDLKGIQRWLVQQIRVNGFSASGGIGIKIDGSYGSTIGAWWNTFDTCDISDNETNYKLVGVSGNGQPNGNRILGGRCQEFTLYGVNIDVGNSCVVDGVDISSTLSHTAGVRLNDHANTVMNCLFDPATIGVKIDGGNNQFVVYNKGYGTMTMVQTNAGSGHTTTPNSVI